MTRFAYRGAAARVAVSGASQLGACATILEGTDQSVTVVTEPPGATCTLMRGGKTIGMVNPTPGSVVLDKSQDNVRVLCTKEDHEDGGATLASSFQGMTFGNLVFGGLIGVAIDAGSGAMHEYPANVTVILPPEEFASEADRDGFYDKLEATVAADADATISELRDRCKPENKAQCDKAVAAIETERDAAIAELRAKRSRARIAAAGS
ncbi:MAG: hypothetical protein ACREER_12525 [Alphaproteobacteria bacterium]